MSGVWAMAPIRVILNVSAIVENGESGIPCHADLVAVSGPPR